MKQRVGAVVGATATKMLSAPFFVLDGSSDFPGRHLKWLKEHEEAGRKKPQSP